MFKTKKEIIDGKFQCSCCKEWKLLNEFPKTSRNPFGIKYTCSKCEWQKSKTRQIRKGIPNVVRDMEGEIWIALKENNSYLISNIGRVKTLDRYVIQSNGRTIFIKGRLIKPTPDKDGYFTIGIKGDVNKRFKIHRLVAEYFVANPKNKPQVNHLDGNKQNNNDWNLEWATLGENRRHEIKHIRKSKYPGVHKSGLKGYVSILKHNKVEYTLGYIPNEKGIEDLAKKYRIAVENFEKHGTLPDGSKV